MRSRRTSISSPSSSPVTAASTSNGTRRPSTAAVSITRRDAGLEIVDLGPHRLGQVPRQRGRAEVVERGPARGDEQLLEEEGVAAAAGVEGLGHPVRRPGAVDRGQEVLDVGDRQPVDADVGGLAGAGRAGPGRR